MRSHQLLDNQKRPKLNFQPTPARSEVIDRGGSQKQEIEHWQRQSKPYRRRHRSTPGRNVQTFPKDVRDKILAFFKRPQNFLP